MSECTAIPTRLSLQGYCICTFYKFFHANFESVQTCLTFNYGEFATIKIRIINLLPYSYKFKRVSIAKPVCHKEITIFCLYHICQTDIILTIYT